MIMGMNISAAGMITSMHRLDTAANNLANLETAGFKSDIASTTARASAREEDNLAGVPGNLLLEALGGGVMLDRTRVNFGQGTIQTTGNGLDLAIEGPGFLSVRNADDQVLLSRDGRLSLNNEGQLVQSATGARILNDGGSTITLPLNTSISIDHQGVIRANNEPVAKLSFTSPASLEDLRKVGAGNYALAQGAQAEQSTGRILQKAIERSAVDPVRAMLDVANAERAAGSGARMVQMYDELLGRTFGTFARVS